jgi:hypothetical protein
MNSGKPLSGYDHNAARIFTAPVTGGAHEDVLFFADTENTSNAFALLRISQDGTLVSENFGMYLNTYQCIASADLGGSGPEKELICAAETGLVIYHGSPAGVYSDDPSMKTEVAMPLVNGFPETATVIDLSGNGLPELILTRSGGTNIVLCQTDNLEFENCTSFIGMEVLVDDKLQLFEGYTFFTVPFPCNPAELGISNICLFETNDSGDSQNMIWRVVRDVADPYGFHLERFDPTDQPGAPANACDRVTRSSCPDWLSLDEPCPEWLYENMKNTYILYFGEFDDAILGIGAFDGVGSDPMGFGCTLFAGDQLCCALSETSGPVPDLMLCHQEGETWRMVHGIGLTKRLTSHGHSTKGWGVAWSSTGLWDKSLIMANGEEIIDDPLAILRDLLDGLLPGYEEHETRGPAYMGYYRRRPNLALDEQSEAMGLTAASGEYATVSHLWLPEGNSVVQHLVFGKWADGFNVYRLDKPEGNFVRFRLYGDMGSDRNGMLAKVTVTDGEHSCTGFFGTESGQPYLAHAREFFCGVGSAKTVTATVQWPPSIKWPNGHVGAFKDVPADSVMTILHESGVWTRDPRAL